MKTLLLIDIHALIHRSFHALPPLTAPNGEPVNVLYGLASTFLKVLREEKPDYIAAAFDRPEPTFRDQLYKDYKAQRPKAPNELISQIIKSRELVENFGFKIFEQPGWEGDDIIGSLAEKFKNELDLKIVILTGDLDALQLVEGEKVVVKTLKKGVSETVIYDEKAVQERYGLLPSQLIDYKSLAGDSSDNIKGAPGIGPKTAVQILSKYKSIDNFYRQIEEDGPDLIPAKEKKLAEKLIACKEDVFLAKKLVTINRNVGFNVKLDDLVCGSLPADRLKDYFNQLGFQSLIKRLPDFPLLMNYSPLKTENNWDGTVGFNLKDLLKNNPLLKEPFFDLGVAAWLIDPDLKDYSPVNLAGKFLRKKLENEQEIADLLFPIMRQKIQEYGLEKIFYDLEMPLLKILAAMENIGIKAERKILEKLRADLNEEIQRRESEIYQIIGEKFNLNSPKQLLEVLNRRFNLKLKSTAAEKLEALKSEFPIMELILNYREDFKIQSTYVEPLLNLIAADGRIHTTFHQTGAATGRLSSSEPNLQNIPQESKWASRLRAAFTAAPGFKLISFDYSQVELRILATVSGDKKLEQAFGENKDIHTLVASQVFNVSLNEVTSEMRRLGKTLNFGVVYGMGATAFSRASSSSKDKAAQFIEEYYSDFPRVREWQEEVRQKARTFGYITNLNGRRRWFLNIQDFNPRIQAEAERAAVNMPIQGLAADILKMAMIGVQNFFEEKKWYPVKARLLLSIHDELLFEISDDILELASAGIAAIMESVYKLDAPLKVKSVSGVNWNELRT